MQNVTYKDEQISNRASLKKYSVLNLINNK